MEGGSLGIALEISVGFGVAPFIGVSGVAWPQPSNVGGIAETPCAFGGKRAGNPAMSKYSANDSAGAAARQVIHISVHILGTGTVAKHFTHIS